MNRDRSIITEYKNDAKATGRSISKKYGLSHERVYQILREDGVKLNKRGLHQNGPRVLIPNGVADMLRRSIISATEAAKLIGCSAHTVRLRMPGLIPPKWAEARRLAEAAYQDYVGGLTAAEVALKYKKSKSSMSRIIFLHRRKHGLPGKRQG